MQLAKPPVSSVSDTDKTSSSEPADSSSAALSSGWNSFWWRWVSESNSWQIAAAVIIGALTALANVAFHWAINRSQEFFWVDIGRFLNVDDLANYNIFRTGLAGIPDHWWVIPLIPMSGMTLIVIMGGIDL